MEDGAAWDTGVDAVEERAEADSGGAALAEGRPEEMTIGDVRGTEGGGRDGGEELRWRRKVGRPRTEAVA